MPRVPAKGVWAMSKCEGYQKYAETKTVKENPGAYYWAESAERERDAERMLRSEPGYRLAMGTDGSVGGGEIRRRIETFFKGR